MNVFETLAGAARQSPDRTAIIDAAGPLSYQSLWRDIEAVRGQLARLGVCEGQGVGVRARNGRAFVTGALAALGSSAVVMPIHHQMKSGELSAMLARAPLSAILDDGCGTGLAGTTGRGVELTGGSGLRFTRLDGPQLPLAPGIDNAAFVRFTSGTTVAGLKVFPEEVAAVLDQHPAVMRSRVTTRPHPQLGEAIHADVQLRNGSPPTASEDILSFCRRRLSNHKVPTSLNFVVELNVTSSGKVRHE